MNNQVVTVNLVPGLSAPAVVRVSQYDYGRPIVFNILDGTQAATIDSSATITVVGTKPSGLGFSETALTISGGAVTLNTTLAMTQESGLIPAEIRIEKQGSDNVGTANFILAVEKTPHADGTTDGTQETMQNLEARLQTEIDGLDDRIEALENAEGSGLTEAVKSAMLQIAQKVAYIDEHGQTYYDALYNALYPPADLVSITAVYTQSGTVYDTDTLDSLKSDLVVTANYSDSTSETVTNYTLSGTLAEGTSVVTVSYGGKTATFEVTVSHQPQTVTVPYSEWTNKESGLIKANGTTHAVGSSEHVQIPYYEGMTVYTNLNNSWNFPKFLVYDNGTYTEITATQYEAPYSHYMATISGFTSSAVVYVNVYIVGNYADYCYYTYEE